MYMAIYEYEVHNKGDITLSVGDRIDRIKYVGCGWVIGHNVTTGETGHFPADYIESVSSWRDKFAFGSSRRGTYKINSANKYSFKTSLKEKGENVGNKQSKTPEKTLDDTNHVDIIEEVQLPTRADGAYERIQKRLFETQSRKCIVVKFLLGVFAGLILGLAIFFALVYSFHYSLLVAGTISGISTFLLCLGLAVSSRCRCVVLLVFPSLTTGKGRAAILSVITGVLLMGPVTNITYNTNEVAVSMACITELAYNQSQALQNKIQEPLLQIRDQITQGVADVKEYSTNINRAFESTRTSLKSAIQKVKDVLENNKNKCIINVDSGLVQCRKKSQELAAKCRSTLSSVNMTTNEIDKVIKAVEDFFTTKRRRRRREVCIPDDQNCFPFQRFRRQSSVLARFCNIFDVPEVICRSVNSPDVCSLVSLPGELLKGGSEILDKALGDYSSLFVVDIGSSGEIVSESKASQTASEIVNNIRSELKSKIDLAKFCINILHRIMSASFVLLVINAVLYERKYASKVSFDNIYITSYFKKIDRKRKLDGKMSVLPLKKLERKLYTDSRSFKMSSAERSKCMIGLTTILLHAVICMMVVIFDFLLHYLLYLLNRHGDVQFVFTGQSDLDIEITGNSIVALLFKTLAGSVKVSQDYNTSGNIQICLPQPREPSMSTIYLSFALYLVALLFVVLQGYGQRLLHFITAFFYPEKEQQRINYLYRKILVKRQNFIKEAKQRILCISNQDAGDQGRCCCNAIMAKFTCSGRSCANCEETKGDISQCKNEACVQDMGKPSSARYNSGGQQVIEA
ncbi:E3 ubiquitin-protein ligase DCST1 isoform X2 [Patella vulgata]|uniref:E3 ubiquitin-protein ligase DCST1 isoform X2 n=1 Tax=Patella vulgata TaxID=6465 RepID=UPI00217F3BCE|nr:E3 ubiquitin-protein ligase DCST1 isoform X2 [Patella vulgata]